jgi:N6-adenosine-specific RNA methylase IME4/ParB-like chromosome segregation protein Spo0J
MTPLDPRAAPNGTLEVNIAGIIIGKRHRREMGDIAALAANIEELGLLQPVVVDRSTGKLVAGERRILAHQHLGRDRIPVTFVDLDEIVAGEFAENHHRKGLTLSESVDIMREVKPREEAAAKQRQGTRTDLGANLAQSDAGRTRDKVARYIGRGRTTLAKAVAIVEAAEAEPEKYGKLVVDMDDTGRANGSFRRLQNMKRAEGIRAEPPGFPGRGPYRGGMIDIAWPYEPGDEDPSCRGALPYPTISLEQACALPIPALLHADAVLAVWVTNFVLIHGFHLKVLAAWGLEPKGLVTWPKEKVWRGYWVKGETEHFVIAVRGNPTITLGEHTTLLKGPFHLVSKGQHSAKPIEAYEWFETYCAAPRYCDLFSRYQHNDRWDCHGDEAVTEVAGDIMKNGESK